MSAYKVYTLEWFAAEVVQSSRILIVDDDPVSRNIIRMMLKSQGFRHFQEAEDGELALQIVRDWNPHLVLLDLLMPKLDGYLVCDKIQEMGLLHPPVIIAQTVVEEPQEKLRAFAGGVTDYIMKPVKEEDLAARCITHLEKHAQMMGLQAYTQRVRGELKDAALLQAEIMPSGALVARAHKELGLDMAGLYQMSSEIGGDFWGMRVLPGKKLALYTVDFSGHGVLAALNTFRLHALVEDDTLPFTHPSALLGQLNQKLYGLLPRGYFATMLYVILDLEQMRMAYATAGAPLPIMTSLNGELVPLEGKGVPLGVEKDTTYSWHEQPLEKGDKLVVCSDALYETFNKFGETIEAPSVASIMSKSRAAQDCVDKLKTYLLSYAEGGKVVDDLTLVSVFI